MEIIILFILYLKLLIILFCFILIIKYQLIGVGNIIFFLLDADVLISKLPLFLIGILYIFFKIKLIIVIFKIIYFLK